MKLKNYLMNEELIKIAEDFDIPIDENLGDGIKQSLIKKKDEIIKAMSFIKSLSLKTVKLTKDKKRIKTMETEMKQAEKELEDVISVVNDALNFMFDGS